MQIQKIFIRNFRSIGEEGLELTFPPGITTFIGENNVGKSSIFQAIIMMINLKVSSTIPWPKENWHESDQNKTIEISLTISLNDNDISKIIPFFEPLDISIDSFKKLFSNTLIYKILITTPFNRPESFFTLGELTIFNGAGRIGNFEDKNIIFHPRWSDLVEIGELKSIKKSIIELYKEKSSYHGPISEQDLDRFDPSCTGIDFKDDMSKLILNLLKENILSIEEYREKPKEELNSSIVSPTGTELASILFNLKNGRRGEKSKFEKIKQKFEEIFPNLDLDVIKEEEEIKIYIQKGKIESTTHFLGAGIIQTLLLITHLVAHEDKIIFVDHPELYLHPQAERNLASLINESKNPQIFLITHSPYFVSLDQQNSIFRFIQKDNKTNICKIVPEYFTDEEYLKFEYLLDIDSKEIFFARKVLLVEGATEHGAIPVFAESMNYSFNKNGISIIKVGGKGNLKFFAKLCRGFEIPCLILADNDAKGIFRDNNYSVIFLPDVFEKILPLDLLEEAKQNIGESKPRIGKYVAKEMVKSKFEVPKEINEVILRLEEM